MQVPKEIRMGSTIMIRVMEMQPETDCTITELMRRRARKRARRRNIRNTRSTRKAENTGAWLNRETPTIAASNRFQPLRKKFRRSTQILAAISRANRSTTTQSAMSSIACASRPKRA